MSMFRMKFGRKGGKALRVVGVAELEALRSEVLGYEAAMRECEQSMSSIQERLDSLASAGHGPAAEQLFKSTAQSTLRLAAGANQRFEAAAVGFLGERRGQKEPVTAYVRRIAIALSDGDAALAMQRRNGIRVDLSTFASASASAEPTPPIKER